MMDDCTRARADDMVESLSQRTYLARQKREKHLIAMSDRGDVDGCVEAVQVALSAFPDTKIKSVTHANTGMKLEFEKPAQKEAENGEQVFD